jgi:thermitase
MRVREGLIGLLILTVGWQLGWGQIDKERTPPSNAFPHSLDAPYAPGELVVGLESAGLTLPIRAMEMVGAITSVNTAIHSYVVRLAPGVTMDSAAAFLSALPGVRYVEPNYFVFILAEPNDPYFGQQYGLTRVQAHLAWDIWRPRRTVYIAVIDTGIDSNHPDLTNKMRRHANGAVYGYNTLNNTTNALDDHGHGTLVAGIAAAEINNGVGIAGVAAWNPNVANSHTYVQLMPVKVIDSSGSGTFDSLARGITWAADNGAQILSMSLGTTTDAQQVRDAVNYAWNRGCLIVAGAGNDGASHAVYPAYYTNCIAVAATDSNDRLADFSQWGSWVDIAAPGVNILSTYPNNQYRARNGTSLACPHVSGAAAMLWSHEPFLTNVQLRIALETNVDPYLPYSGRTIAPNAGRVNVYRALQAVDDLPERPQIAWLGTLGQTSVARGVSDLGNVVVGWFTTSDGKNFAFRWTPSAGMQNLGTFPQYITSEAYGVSADGNRVAGVSHNVASAWKAFLWTPENGLRDLGSLGGNRSVAHGISADGSVLVGRSNDLSGRMYAFRWTQSNGMQSLGTLGGSESRAFGVSRNGGVIVGWSLNHLGEIWAFRWTSAGGMQGLYPLAACCGEAYGVSDDGLVIAGRAHSAVTERWHACLWTWNGSDYSPRDLGTLGGNESQALACTNNQIAVGWAHNASGQRRAFRWTQARGMEDLTMTYARLLSPGSFLEVAYDITPDGRFIVGHGYNAATGRQEAFLLHTLCIGHNGDVDGNGCIDDADLLAVLFEFGNSGDVLGGVDVNCDGTVDDADLLQVLFNFGSGC